MAINYPHEVKEILNNVYNSTSGAVNTQSGKLTDAALYTWNPTAGTVATSVTLSQDIMAEAMALVGGTATGEVDKFTITDSAGNIYYSGSVAASATSYTILNIRVLNGMNLNFVATVTSGTPSGVLHIYGYY